MESAFGRLKSRLFRLRGRQARLASPLFNGIKTFGQTLVMWTVFLGVGPLVLWEIENRLGISRFMPLKTAATALFLAGWVLAWTSAYFMVTRGEGTPLPVDSLRRLVVAGPYRWVRNPMAMGSLAQGLAIGLYFGSPMIVLYVVAGAMGWNSTVRPWEEADLGAKFGAEYARYRRAVRCWAPRLSRYKP
ncbi:MAG: isoprenylcysteine carboxylmethyltransferase family protein [Armatimonadetes bacterium]|nr:isoprenylcysteine carboxylmethyltransferase family protein [Armatimonadota bacterium]